MTNKPTAPDLREDVAKLVREACYRHQSAIAIGSLDDLDMDYEIVDAILALLPAPIPQGENGWLETAEKVQRDLNSDETGDAAIYKMLAVHANAIRFVSSDEFTRLIAIARAAGGRA